MPPRRERMASGRVIGCWRERDWMVERVDFVR